MLRKQQTAGLLWLADLAGAALFAWGIADAVGAMAQNVALPLAAPAAMVCGGGLRAFAAWSVHAYAIGGAQQVAAALRQRLFLLLLGRPLARPPTIGQAAVFAIDHPAMIENYEARFVPARLAAVAAPLAVIAVVAAASLVAAGILFATLAPFALGMALAGTMARRASERQLDALGLLSGLFVDRIRMLPLIRHFGAEERIARQVDAGTHEVAERTIAVLRAAFLSSAVLEFFSALAIALVAVYCGFSLLGLLPFPAPESLDLRAAFFALAMAPEFYLPMRRLAAAYHDKQIGEAARTALAALDKPQPAPAGPAAAFAGVTVRDLEIHRPGCPIGPVSLALGAVGLAAVTGPTGSGKTSLLAAIAGQLAPVAGHLAAIDPADIGWAAQRPLLLPGSLRDNLLLAQPAASEAELQAAIAAVGLAPLVAARGLDLPLDHRGAGLSGGERRRLGLARAILSRRPLLLCDEPTADLDDDAAAAIVRLLAELARSRAVIVATHDARLVAVADTTVAL
jgi:ATP-binding cassette subfamily C protein CydD